MPPSAAGADGAAAASADTDDGAGRGDDGAGNAAGIGEKNKDDGEKEEEDEWIDVLGSGNLLKRVVREGRGHDTRPERGQLARFTLRVTVDGEPAEGEGKDAGGALAPLEVVVGEHDDALALDLVLPLMQLGEVCEVNTTTRYDNRPVPSPDASIAYEVELLEVVDAPPVREMPRELCLARAAQKKERANGLHARGLHDDACGQLRRAIGYLAPSDDGAGEGLADEEAALAAVCWSNLAAALLKLGNNREVVKACDSALELQPGSEKAMFRKAKALVQLKEFEDARACLTTLLSASPKNTAALRLQREVQQKQREAKEAERELARKMVSALDGSSADATLIHEEQQKRNELRRADAWWDWATTAAVVTTAVAVLVTVSIAVMQVFGGVKQGAGAPPGHSSFSPDEL